MDNPPNNKIRLLTISQYGEALAAPAADSYSGAQKRQLDYARMTEQYLVIVPSAKPLQVNVLAENLRIFPVSAGNKILFILKACRLAGKLIRQEKINCLACDNPFLLATALLWLKKRFRIPLIVNSMAEMVDNDYYLRERPSNILKNWLGKIAFKHADIIRVSTEAEVSNLVKRDYRKEKIIKVPFYIDFEKFELPVSAEDLRKDLLGEAFDKIVLFVGRFAKQKDLPTLIKAAGLVIKNKPRTLFLSIGYGPELSAIVKEIDSSGLAANFKILGKVRYNEMAKYYLASDIFCITSLYEGTCMVLLEAGICGLPIVATKFAGAVDLVKNGVNGFLAEIGDYKEVSEKVSFLLERSNEVRVMGENNRRIIKEDFTREGALKKFQELMDLVI